MKATKPVFLAAILAVSFLDPALSSADSRFTVLHSFSGNWEDGSSPLGSLLLVGDTLYGLTPTGGASDRGTVFCIHTDGSAYEVMDSFDDDGPDAGKFPQGSIIYSSYSGAFYGTTREGGGEDDWGTIFSIQTGARLQTSYSFDDGIPGYFAGFYPYGDPLLVDGFGFFGMTHGANGGGDNIYNNGGGYGLHSIHAFTGGTDNGDLPFGNLVTDGASLYGMTSEGGQNGWGTIFSIPITMSVVYGASPDFVILHSFSWGELPSGSLLLEGDTLYGMTGGGGTELLGTIFSIQTDGSDFTVLHSFGESDGIHPRGNLILAKGSLYGMTYSNGPDGRGTIFAIDPDGTDFTVLYGFAGGSTDGATPQGSLLIDGNVLYGMTSAGGESNLGIVFSLQLPSPTPTPADYKTPTPVPSATPTPEGYCTPSTSPTCIPSPSVAPSSTTSPTPYTAAFPFYEGFESGKFGGFWTISTSGQGGQVTITSEYPSAGSNSARLFKSSGSWAFARLFLTVDLSQQTETNVDLNFAWQNFQTDCDMYHTVLVSDDFGDNWEEISSLCHSGPISYREQTLPLSELSKTHTFTFNEFFQIQFRWFSNNYISQKGIALDEIFVCLHPTPFPSVTPTPTPSVTPTPTPSVTPTPTPTPYNIVGWTPTSSPTPYGYKTSTPTPSPPPTPIDIKAIGDYNGDGTTDLAIFRPSNSLWLVRGLTRIYFGNSDDEPLPQDYDGDGTWDMAFTRPSNNLWKVKDLTRIYFGTGTDEIIPGDYNGDGTADPAYFRPSTTLWNVRGITRVYFGTSSDIPIPNDYDGDGSADLTFFRGSSGLWRVRDFTNIYFGAADDTLVPGDYDGDGTVDFAWFRRSSGLWKIKDLTRIYFGTSGDVVIPGDYDGDGTTDYGYFRPSFILWKVKDITRVYFGQSSDTQVTNPYTR